MKKRIIWIKWLTLKHILCKSSLHFIFSSHHSASLEPSSTGSPRQCTSSFGRHVWTSSSCWRVFQVEAWLCLLRWVGTVQSRPRPQCCPVERQVNALLSQGIVGFYVLLGSDKKTLRSLVEQSLLTDTTARQLLRFMKPEFENVPTLNYHRSNFMMMRNREMLCHLPV